MKKIIAIILCIVLLALALSACSLNIGKILPDKNNGNNGNNSNSSQSDSNGNGGSDNASGGENAVTEIPTEAGGFVEPEYATNHYQPPANPDNTLNSVSDPSGDGFRFVYDETGRIVKCYYTENGLEVYLNYVYGQGWVEIYGFIGETLVCDEVIQLPGEFNPDAGLSVVRGYYIKGYVF